jgi:hypothetical protein
MTEKTVTEQIRDHIENDVPPVNLEEMGVEPKNPNGPGLKGLWVARREEIIKGRKIETPSIKHEGD